MVDWLGMGLDTAEPLEGACGVRDQSEPMLRKMRTNADPHDLGAMERTPQSGSKSHNPPA
eukprot:3325297-Amphidinium_carterae.2